MLGFIFFSLLVLLFVLLLRFLASLPSPIIAAILPANSTALVLTKRNTMGKDSRGNPVVNNDGGNVTNVIHAVPGRRLDRSDPDPYNWKMVKGIERRGILFATLGIMVIGFFRYLRINDVRTFRYGRKDIELKYSVQPKSLISTSVWQSGQHDIWAMGIEMSGIIKTNLLFNILYEETFPVRVRLRTADPFAVLDMKVKRVIIAIAGQTDAQILIQDAKIQQAFADKILELAAPEVIIDLGLTIISVALADISYFDDATTKLVELEKRTSLQNAAAIATAEKDKLVKILKNDADADRVERVYKPTAHDELRVKVRMAEAYENNQKITVFAPGAGNTMIPLNNPSKEVEENQETVPKETNSENIEKVSPEEKSKKKQIVSAKVSRKE
ncbi:MAG: hypothetical protein CO183_01205 [Candidatus Zambryskibacteria bacterium CG_4_9_14_3_um_filter_42_9]|uniref:Band 7 domain-containing protein n=1 Tax=Candidatus Zambryskibacteria bacterium CG22_combo_CG10-13_8_21_14_all_42_17 TaxID=1975118 RepID=A0A2H0BG23_9BACT|nr:MAG: hypothetical protein COX06_00520 [Candidatus Zambryskibacteria bacterium CG22_combo_CG10-13_8_21_14_all_42_17]PJA36867.1 MAG: hypothetical protein CO183_01205 [Candidatus Zambryskibacteria bacterium CG_4_9_14_3_um_filter_42_9]